MSGTYSPVLLGSVLNNLCCNAIHYTREGRVELIETDEGVIVCDTGGGIAPEDVARMFEPGFRGAAGESAPRYGLGLPIIARICTRCGWSIHYAPLDNGSSFHLFLTQTAEHGCCEGLGGTIFFKALFSCRHAAGCPTKVIRQRPGAAARSALPY